MSVVRTQVDKASRRWQKQLDQRIGQLTQQASHLDRHDAEQGALRGRMDDMRKALAVAHERPRGLLRITNGFDREVDGAVVAAMSQKHAVAGAVLEQLQTWLQTLGFGSEECEIKETGEGPTKRCLVSFKGLAAPACRKAGRVRDSLKKSNRWRGSASPIQTLSPVTAGAPQSCLLCCQPEPMHGKLPARSAPFAEFRPCRLPDCIGHVFHMVWEACAGAATAPPPNSQLQMPTDL